MVKVKGIHTPSGLLQSRTARSAGKSGKFIYQEDLRNLQGVFKTEFAQENVQNISKRM